MSSALYRLAGFMLVLCAFHGAEAQDAGQANSHVAAEVPHLEDVPRVPGVTTHWRGFNAGVTFSGVHDSSTGWHTVATPAVSYSLTPHYSADASISIYPTRQVETQNPGPQQARQFVLRVGDLGDTFIGLHASFTSRIMRNTATALPGLAPARSHTTLAIAWSTTTSRRDFCWTWEREILQGSLIDL